MEKNFDQRHRVALLSDLHAPNDLSVTVNFLNRHEPGLVTQPAGTPQSYLVETSSGTVMWNHLQLVSLPTEISQCDHAHLQSKAESPKSSISSRNMTRSLTPKLSHQKEREMWTVNKHSYLSSIQHGVTCGIVRITLNTTMLFIE